MWAAWAEQAIADPVLEAIDFHGYLRAPLRVGVGALSEPLARTPIHAPEVPDDQYFSPQYTSVQSPPWAELYLSYTTGVARATIGLAGQNFTDSSFTDPTTTIGIAQGFVTLTPVLPHRLRLEARIGSFSDTYDPAEKYDTTIAGKTHLMGERLKLDVDLGRVGLWVEQGFGGKQPAPNEYNSAQFSLVHHEHVGVRLGPASLRAHLLEAWSDEGWVSSMGLELDLDAARLGVWHLSGSEIEASTARTVAGAFEAIHSFGGGEFDVGLVDNYLDGPEDRSGGSGLVDTLYAQHDLSLARSLGQRDAWGDSDVTVTTFAMAQRVTSRDPAVGTTDKLKWGADLGGEPAAQVGFGFRFDRVEPGLAAPDQSFAILSPRVVLRTRRDSHERITLQYSRYLYDRPICPDGGPSRCTQPSRSGERRPLDVDVFKLEGSMWW